MRISVSINSRLLQCSVLLIGLVSCQVTAAAAQSNGFDLSNSSLPREQIIHGGPPRDGIPAISDPKLVRAAEAAYLEPMDRVVGIELDGEARAYPVPILNWHEIVNDQIGDRRVAITYCPLCGTAVAFDSTIDGQATDFGVSGLLYNSDVLLYDRATESLWSQILAESVAGRRVGMKLKPLPISHTTWRDWSAMHPDTLVLSDDTGYFRDYSRDPYAGYLTSRHTYFAVNNEAPDNYHPKEIVVGLGVGGVYRAYPFIELERQGARRFSDTINGTRFHFDWDSENRSVTVTDDAGEAVVSVQGFWFAWFAFHPDTEVYRAVSN